MPEEEMNEQVVTPETPEVTEEAAAPVAEEAIEAPAEEEANGDAE